MEEGTEAADMFLFLKLLVIRIQDMADNKHRINGRAVLRLCGIEVAHGLLQDHPKCQLQERHMAVSRISMYAASDQGL